MRNGEIIHLQMPKAFTEEKARTRDMIAQLPTQDIQGSQLDALCTTARRTYAEWRDDSSPRAEVLREEDVRTRDVIAQLPT
jgi:hypothetical protein